MKNLFFILVLSLFFVSSISRADIAQNPNFVQLPSGQFSPQEIKAKSENSPVFVGDNRSIDLKPIVVSKKYSQKYPQLLKSIEEEEMQENQNSHRKSDFDIKDKVSSINNFDSARRAGLISSITPDYAINKNFLSLTKVSKNRRKQALMFTFLMNKDKKEDVNKSAISKFSSRTRMHILGPTRLFPEQQVIDDELPVNVSTAKYEDGFAKGEWNFILPSKKPREVDISLMWSF